MCLKGCNPFLQDNVLLAYLYQLEFALRIFLFVSSNLLLVLSYNESQTLVLLCQLFALGLGHFNPWSKVDNILFLVGVNDFVGEACFLFLEGNVSVLKVDCFVYIFPQVQRLTPQFPCISLRSKFLEMGVFIEEDGLILLVGAIAFTLSCSLPTSLPLQLFVYNVGLFFLLDKALEIIFYIV